MDFDFLELAQNSCALNMETYQQFHQLMEQRTIIVNGEINEAVVENVILPLRDFEKDNSNEPVILILNTPGGSVADGLVLCNIIDSYTKPLHIYVLGYSCSMGTLILCSGNNNPNVTKFCYPFSFALLHLGHTTVSGETGSVDDVIDFNRAVEQKIRQYITSNTKISEEEYDKHNRKQWYLTSEEMLEKGLINVIIK